MIDIARNIVPCSDKQDMKSRNGSYFQPSFSTRKRQRISSDLFSELPQKRSKTTNGRIWNKATYSFSSQILCTISSKVIRMWASFRIFELHYSINIAIHPFHNMIPLLEALYTRHSVRRYLHQPLTPQLIAQLQTKIDECNRLGNLHIQLVTNETRAFSGVMAYGSFSGVENYLVMVGKPHPTLDERIGYYGEQLVLFAQQLGLNTCWAGLSYRKVKGAYHVSSGEKLVCMIALGYGKTQGVTHKIKRPEEVSNIGAQTPEWFAKGVEAALLAPTAINQQKFYFEYQSCPEDPRHGVKAIRRFSLVGYTQMDLGIAKLHFEIGAAAASGVAEAEALFRWME